MKITDGLDEVIAHYDAGTLSTGLIEALWQRVRSNWLLRQPDRWPSDKNWQLRFAPDVTFHPEKRLEKQLQKAIANCHQDQGWGNDVPTASGLIDSGHRQMNIDLVQPIAGGFNFIELKIGSDEPRRAAYQALRYAAIYLLYRLEPELQGRFESNAMLSAQNACFEVLAPARYYRQRMDGLAELERSINLELEEFRKKHDLKFQMSFYFRQFTEDFEFIPGADCGILRRAVQDRRSPFDQQVLSQEAVAGETWALPVRDDEYEERRRRLWAPAPGSWLEGWKRLAFYQKLSVIGIVLAFSVWFWNALGRAMR